jgi:hypothetical protein
MAVLFKQLHGLDSPAVSGSGLQGPVTAAMLSSWVCHGERLSMANPAAAWLRAQQQLLMMLHIDSS